MDMNISSKLLPTAVLFLSPTAALAAVSASEAGVIHTGASVVASLAALAIATLAAREYTRSRPAFRARTFKLARCTGLSAERCSA